MQSYELSSRLRTLADEVDHGMPAPLTYGEIIDQLQSLVEAGKGERYIHFEFGCAWPTGVESYRGDYSQIALEYSGGHSDHQTVERFLQLMREKRGGFVEGWKGGEFPVKDDCDVYVVCPGNVSDTRVSEIVCGNSEYCAAIIKTIQWDD